ncbi:MAG: UDP-3-O-(3-hydroxymyristoyl)glucosamine N-acyltransferase [Candidatus Acidiferrales bacterium]
MPKTRHEKITRTARQMAEALGAQLEGDPTARISGIAGPESAGPEDLIYVNSAKNLGSALGSAAVCVLAPRELHVAGKTVLRVADPKLAFAKTAAILLPPTPIATGVHSSAVIDSTARLAKNVSVGPYAVIEENAEIEEGTEIGAFCFIGRESRIGENCRLFPRVTLYAGMRLGRGVIIHSGTVIGGDGFGYVSDDERHWKFPQAGTVEIGDDVEIGCNTTIDRGSLGITRIGAGTKIDNLVQIAHNVQMGHQAIIVSQTGISGSCSIGNRAMIGGQAGLGEHCTIEDGAILGGQAGILPGKIIRSGQIVWGTPARPLARFKEQFAWLSHLPELARRVSKLEAKQDH